MITYKEYVFNILDNTDYTDRGQAAETAMTLADAAITKHRIIGKYDEKVRELMTEKDYSEWVKKTAEEMYIEDIEAMRKAI